jgi:hypothetical protein
MDCYTRFLSITLSVTSKHWLCGRMNLQPGVYPDHIFNITFR